MYAWDVYERLRNKREKENCNLQKFPKFKETLIVLDFENPMRRQMTAIHKKVIETKTDLIGYYVDPSVLPRN